MRRYRGKKRRRRNGEVGEIRSEGKNCNYDDNDNNDPKHPRQSAFTSCKIPNKKSTFVPSVLTLLREVAKHLFACIFFLQPVLSHGQLFSRWHSFTNPYQKHNLASTQYLLGSYSYTFVWEIS